MSKNNINMAETLNELSDIYYAGTDGPENISWDAISHYDGESYFVHEQGLMGIIYDCQDDPALMANFVRILIDKLAEEQGQ